MVSIAKTVRDEADAARANAVRNAIALKRHGTPTHGGSAHTQRRTSTSARQSTAPVRLRGVRTDDVIRQLPGTRRRALPLASEHVVLSARPSLRRDVFASDGSRRNTRSGDVGDAARRGRLHGPGIRAGLIRSVSPRTDLDGLETTSTMPLLATRRRNTSPYMASRSRNSHRGAESTGKASITCCAVHAAVGCSVMLT
jgi:hypothetical protein